MLTYQIRPRVYRLAKGREFSFPNDAELVFYFKPLQPFGEEVGGGRTAIKAVEGKVIFNANTGQYWDESKIPLKPLDVILKEPARLIKMQGNELHIQERFESLKEMNMVVQSLFFSFPTLLNIEFADPPFIERVDGTVGNVPFRWELDNWCCRSFTTTQKLQEKRIAWSWNRINILSNSDNLRIVAALHYFYVACRLCRAGNSPWEFMSEVILNLSKVLEVLFPPITTNGKTIDAVRIGLKELGYSNVEADCHFTPIMAIRNYIDSAHVDLSILTEEQRTVLHTYTEAAETAFRDMLRMLITKTQRGEYHPIPYGEPSVRREVEKIIERISKYSVKYEVLKNGQRICRGYK